MGWVCLKRETSTSAAPAAAVCFQARGPGVGDAFCRSRGTVNRERPGAAGSPAFALAVQLGCAEPVSSCLGLTFSFQQPCCYSPPTPPPPPQLLGCVWSCVCWLQRACQRPDGFDMMVFPGAFPGVALTPYHTVRLCLQDALPTVFQGHLVARQGPE